MNIAIGFIVLSFLVLVHELGHLVVGRLCGMKALSFSIGFGRPIIAFRWGSTIYKIAMIPLGGYVRFVIPTAANERKHTKSRWAADFLLPLTDAEKALLVERAGENWNDTTPVKRIAMVLGGPAANLLVAFAAALVIPLYFMRYFEHSPELTIGLIHHERLTEAGLAVGDTVQAINGQAILSWSEYAAAAKAAQGHPATMELVRSAPSGESSAFEITIHPSPEFETAALLMHVRPVIRETRMSIWMAVKGVVGMMGNLVGMLVDQTQTVVGSPGQAIGPFEGYQRVGASASLSALDFVATVIFLSLGLAVFNLLPLPALDGGQLVFFVIEWIAGKPLPAAVRHPLEGAVLGTVLLLTVLLLIKDTLFFMG